MRESTCGIRHPRRAVGLVEPDLDGTTRQCEGVAQPVPGEQGNRIGRLVPYPDTSHPSGERSGIVDPAERDCRAIGGDLDEFAPSRKGNPHRLRARDSQVARRGAETDLSADAQVSAIDCCERLPGAARAGVVEDWA